MIYRSDIDGLRAFAVLSVVTYHLDPKWLPGGFIGVDVFFVISGYLITNIIFREIDKNEFALVQFYARRIRRIFPALLIVLAASIAFGWFALVPTEFSELGKQVAAGAAFVSNFTYWSEAGYFDNLAETKPLLHLWSLAVEEQFYLFWPALILFALKKGWKISRVTTVTLCLSFAASLVLLAIEPDAAFFWPFGRLWELLTGALLVCAERSIRNSRVSGAAYKGTLSAAVVNFRLKDPLVSIRVTNILSISGAIALTFGVVSISDNDAFPGLLVIIPVAGAAAIIFSGPDAWINKFILSNGSVVFIGLVSYPLYLWHWPLISFLWITEGAEPGVFPRLSAGILAFLLAVLTYWFIERPIRKTLNLRTVCKILLALLLIVFVSGLTIDFSDGFRFRDNMRNYYKNFLELQRTPKSDDACEEIIRNTNSHFPYCRYSNVNGRQTIAIIGDSHAHAAYEGIAAGFESHNINTLLLANSGCPPLLGYPTWAPKGDKELCNRQIAQILDVLLLQGGIDHVLMITRGPIYFTGTEPSNENYRSKSSIGEISLDNFIRGTQATIDYLTSNGKQVHYLSENPELKIHARFCLERPFRSNQKHCVLEKKEVLNRQGAYLAAITGLKDIILISSIDAFCPNDHCLVYEDGSILYADDDHVSVFGSKFLFEKLISPSLLKIILRKDK